MMESFLKWVAADLYRRTNGHPAHTAVVFPNKRAGLFFNEYLAAEASSPVWSPAYLSITELFHGLSDREPGDPVKMVCELHKVFCREAQSRETLDDFYPWGEMLISDFDDADKNLVDTDMLFANLRDLHRLMDDHTFVDAEQEKAIRRFFQHFSIERPTTLKDRFTAIWNVLGAVYKGFRDALSAQGIAYEGMLCRRVVERLDPDKLPYERYVFVGFNVLNKVEHRLFEQLQRAGRALFYWDYDKFYMEKPRHEAGEFIRQNLKDFPSPLPAERFDTLSRPKEIRYVASPTENAQARYLPEWIRAHLTEDEKETAVVLCNEALLQPVLHSLPGEVKHINVTMGFPLSQTPVYSFLTTLLEVHTQGYNPRSGRFAFAPVAALLRHPYTRRLTPQASLLEKELTRHNRFYPLPGELGKDACLTLLFTPAVGNKALCGLLAGALEAVAGACRESSAPGSGAEELYRESLFKAYTTVNRFRTLLEEGELAVQTETLRRLLVRVLSGAGVPFHGEPAVGMQVMGLLETRNLDFRPLVLLSVNEGQLPKAGNEASFIPYNLRKAFGMTTPDRRVAVYAYYFYRLLQRAEKVTLLYNTASDGLNRGEWSRFLLQFLVEWPHPVFRGQLEAGQSPRGTSSIKVEKTPEVLRRLQEHFDLRLNGKAKFSPSALNNYLDCPLKFYYKYVAKLAAPDEVSAEIDSAMFGSIFHRAAECIYKEMTARGNVIDKDTVEAWRRDEARLQERVDAAFRELFFRLPAGEKPEYNGVQLLNSAVIARFLRQLLFHDARYAPFTFAGSEREVQEEVAIRTPRGILPSRIGGIIDRMDLKGDTLRVVDYKTGGEADIPPDVASLFVPGEKRSNYVFQTCLYAAIMCRREPSRKIAPALLYIHHAASDDYSPVIQMGGPRMPKEPVADFRPHEAEFRARLQALLEEIFDPSVPFTQTKTEGKCAYCDFRSLCRR